MATSQTQAWAERLRSGGIELFDLNSFEELSIDVLDSELGTEFPVRFLERRHGTKREIGRAHSLTRRRGSDTTVLQQCLMYTSELGIMTSMAVMTQLRVRRSAFRSLLRSFWTAFSGITHFRVQRPSGTEGEFEFTSGAGYSVYRDPDGWRIKLLRERTVFLTAETLKGRGWLLDEVATMPESNR